MQVSISFWSRSERNRMAPFLCGNDNWLYTLDHLRIQLLQRIQGILVVHSKQMEEIALPLQSTNCTLVQHYFCSWYEWSCLFWHGKLSYNAYDRGTDSASSCLVCDSICLAAEPTIHHQLRGHASNSEASRHQVPRLQAGFAHSLLRRDRLVHTSRSHRTL